MIPTSSRIVARRICQKQVRVISRCRFAIRNHHAAESRAMTCTRNTRCNMKHFSTSAKLQAMGNPTLLTLRPEKMVAVGQEVFDLAGKHRTTFFTEDKISSVEYFGGYKEHRSWFTEGAKGVLYFHHNVQDEKTSQVRFRLCEDVSQFDAGKDFLRPNGKVWNLSLRALRKGGGAHQGIISLLKAEYKTENILNDDWITGDRYVQRPVLTLCHENFVPLKQEVIDISRLHSVNLHIPTNDSLAASPKTPEGFYVDRVVYMLDKPTEIPFPPNTKGIFYYDRPSSHRAPFGQLRFRNCSDAASFDRGTDLCFPSGEPWRLDLWNIMSRNSYLGIQHLLVKEGLVERHFVADLRNRLLKRPTVLFTLDEPFVLDLSRYRHTFQLVVAGSKIYPFVVRYMTKLEDGLEHFSFRGRVMARFELSTLPEHAKYGPTLVLRILEILTPIEPVKPLRPGLAFPKPGSLLSFKDKKVWKFCIEKRRTDRAVLTAFIEKSQTRSQT